MWAGGLAFAKQTVFVGAGEDGLLIYDLSPLPKETHK
jgi:hypothetical protein